MSTDLDDYIPKMESEASPPSLFQHASEAGAAPPPAASIRNDDEQGLALELYKRVPEDDDEEEEEEEEEEIPMVSALRVTESQIQREDRAQIELERQQLEEQRQMFEQDCQRMEEFLGQQELAVVNEQPQPMIENVPQPAVANGQQQHTPLPLRATENIGRPRLKTRSIGGIIVVAAVVAVLVAVVAVVCGSGNCRRSSPSLSPVSNTALATSSNIPTAVPLEIIDVPQAMPVPSVSSETTPTRPTIKNMPMPVPTPPRSGDTCDTSAQATADCLATYWFLDTSCTSCAIERVKGLGDCSAEQHDGWCEAIYVECPRCSPCEKLQEDWYNCVCGREDECFTSGGVIATTPIATRSSLIRSYINSITLTSQSIQYPSNATAEERALLWLIDDDHGTSESDNLALLQRYSLSTLWFQTTTGFGNSGWATNITECEWEGVDCDTAGRLVTSLNLYSGVEGHIPDDLGLLTALTRLDFSTNALKGTIPTAIGSLTALTFLSLSFNELTSTIPSSMSSLTALTYLSVRGNAMSGTIPSSIISLTDLTDFFSDNNDLTGTMPFCGYDQSFVGLVADCYKMTCSCCTRCCPTSRDGIPAFGLC